MVSISKKAYLDETILSRLLITQKKPDVSVIIPALNEAENLPFVLPKIPHWIHEVILVDGNSTDNTIEVAKQLLPNIKILMQEGKGKGAALRTGVHAATGDIVVLLDADGSTDPTEIPHFCALLRMADYVKGSRFLQGSTTLDMPLFRKCGNTAFVVLTNVLFGTQFTDITYGYNAFWREHADKLALEIDGWACEIIGNIRAANNGLRVLEVPCIEYKRIAGEAKLMTFSAGWTILKAILKEGLHHYSRFFKNRFSVAKFVLLTKTSVELEIEPAGER